MARLRSRIYDTDSLEDHALLIARQTDISVKDPATRKLAVQLASGRHGWATAPGTRGRIPAVKYHGNLYEVRGNRCAPKDAHCAIANIWNFIVLNVRYTGDIDTIDTYQDLRTTLEIGGGDCDDFTIAFGALLRSIGYTMYQKIISLDGEHWAHVYPVVDMGEGNRPIVLDATENGRPMGWEYPYRTTEKLFPLTED